MMNAVPERRDEIQSLWQRYNPDVAVVNNAQHITLNATKERIQCDAKTIEVFWLIGFSGWRAIECYSPHIVVSNLFGKTITDLLRDDQELDEVERAYKERRAAAQIFIDAKDPASVPWPPDLPRLNCSRSALDDAQYKAAFDLTGLAIAFVFLHEFHHVMLDRDRRRPQDRREEELACDVWARTFMTAKLASYKRSHGHNYREVLRKRSMGFALAALVLHEITPFWDHGGNAEYFSIATRLRAILTDTALPEDDYFWTFAASLLIGVIRQKGLPVDAPVMSAKQLTDYLLKKL